MSKEFLQKLEHYSYTQEDPKKIADEKLGDRFYYVCSYSFLQRDIPPTKVYLERSNILYGLFGSRTLFNLTIDKFNKVSKDGDKILKSVISMKGKKAGDDSSLSVFTTRSEAIDAYYKKRKSELESLKVPEVYKKGDSSWKNNYKKVSLKEFESLKIDMENEEIEKEYPFAAYYNKEKLIKPLLYTFVFNGYEELCALRKKGNIENKSIDLRNFGDEFFVFRSIKDAVTYFNSEIDKDIEAFSL